MKRSPLIRKTPLQSKRNQKSRQKKTVSKSVPKKSEYTKELRESIYERDNGRCVICGRAGEQVHHVIPKGRFYAKWYTVDSVHDPRNLMLVCAKCHHFITTNNDALEAAVVLQEKRFGPLRRDFG